MLRGVHWSVSIGSGFRRILVAKCDHSFDEAREMCIEKTDAGLVAKIVDVFQELERAFVAVVWMWSQTVDEDMLDLSLIHI